MRRSIYILLLIFATNPVFAQISQENGYNLDIPENISTNDAFDISLIASNPYDKADKLVLYFNTSSRINFKSLELRAYSNLTTIPCKQIDLEGEEGNVYRADIDFTKNKIASNTYFQLLFNLKADNAVTTNFQFSGIFKDGGKTIGYLWSSDNFQPEDTLRFSSIQLKFYKPQRFAENSIQLNTGSELNIALNDQDVNNLLTEFWIEISNKQTDFLKIINKQSGGTLFNISTNEFQMIQIQTQNQLNQELINPYFISRDNWYHFSILTSFDENSLNIYCSNTLIGRYSIPSFLKVSDLEWNFGCDAQNKSFRLDVLRFVDLNNDLQFSFLNKNYLNFIGENTEVLYQFNFDDEDELYLAKDRINVTYNQINFVKSDAPIFARAPELNINLLGNVYELTWSGGDYGQARSYYLEKSLNNAEYQQVSSIQADNSYEKNYSLLDAKDPAADIVYYRIKQVNNDGSIVYSSQVKIGQGTTEPFVVEQNYPNPFNPRTSIVVDLLEDSDVEITVYNLEGKEISKLFKGFLTSGTHKFSFDASELSSGIYLYKVATPNFSNTKKMILTK